MSTCLILTQGNKIYVGADTACSVKTSHGYKRISNDMQKLFSIGNNIFFCSGKKTSVDTCVKWIYSNFENNIDISRLKEYLKYNFSFQNEEKIFDIEFLLCDYDNCQISQLSQYNNFEPIIYEFSNQVRIICGGYKTKDSFMIAQNNILSRNSIYEIYKNVFENISDECVGGKIVLYSSPTNKSIFEIRENNIEYARIEELFLLTSDFVTAGFVYGSQIINGDIYSEDYRESDGVGSHIGLKGTGSFQFGRKFSFDGTNLELSGRITAESGYIGSDEYDYQWLIGNDTDRAYIYNGTNSMTSTTVGTYLGTDGFRNYQSNEAYTNIQNGILKCNGAEFSGAIIGSSFYASGKVVKNASDYTEDDATKIRDIIIGNIECTPEYVEKYDIDGNGVIDGLDYLRVRKMLLGESSSYSYDTYIKISPANVTNIIQTEGVSINMNGIYTKNIRTERAYIHDIRVPNPELGSYESGFTGRINIGEITLCVSNGIITTYL